MTDDIKNEEIKFTKEQILNSKKYASQKDIVSILLREGINYSLNEVNKLIAEFMKGKVKRC